MNEQLKFFKGKETSLGNINPQAGSIYHCEDTGNTYLANENSELEIYSNTFTFSEAEADASAPINADTLGGHPASDFALTNDLKNLKASDVGAATEAFVTNKIAEAQLGGDSSEIDLSGYATKDDLAKIDYPVDSVNGKTGAVQLNASDVGAAKSLTEKLVMSYADNHPAPNDLLNVSLDGNRDADDMQPSRIATEDASTLVNSPVNSGAFYAVRTVECFPNVGHVIVRLHESYPDRSRIWSNMYDNNVKTWYGWVANARDVYSVNGKTGAVSLNASDVGAAPASLAEHVDFIAINNNKLIKENIITDVLGVDLTNPNGNANRSGYFNSSAANCPPNTAFGVRDVYWVAANFVIIEARCFITDSSSRIVRRTYNANAGGWGNWEWLDKREFAPSGYGLGGGAYQLTSANNLNTIRENGWYSWSSSSKPANAPTGDGTNLLDVMRVTGTGAACIQEVFDVSNGSNCGVKMQRIIYGNNYVSAWEWVNPPMTLGKEYRTTERYKGKPVYATTVNFGALPNATIKGVAHGVSIDQPVRIEGRTSQRISLPYSIVTELYFEPSSVVITTNTDASHITAEVTIYYTKN